MKERSSRTPVTYLCTVVDGRGAESHAQPAKRRAAGAGVRRGFIPVNAGRDNAIPSAPVAATIENTEK